MENVIRAEALNPAPAFEPDAPEPQKFVLKRTGRVPRVFSGEEVCCGTSYTPGPPFWFEVNVYQTVEDKIVVEIKTFYKDEDKADRFVTYDFHTVGEVAEFLESYDATTGLVLPWASLIDDDLPAVELALTGFQLRFLVEEARRQFADLVGEVLFTLPLPD